MKDIRKSKASNAKKEPASPSRARVSLAEGKASRRVDALFKTLSADYLLREQFVTDPAQVLSEYVSGRPLSQSQSDAANQLLYSVLSNPRLRDWLTRYASGLGGATPTRHGLAVQLARAVGSRGDDLTALALIRAATAGHDHFVAQADLLRAVITVIGGRFGSSGTEMSPGGGTEMSPGGTEMSPGAIFSGTEMSPGGGTEMSPGGTEMSPGAIFSGTEMSPGGGTEMSPGGTGTEMSPGALGLGPLPGYLQVTLGALVAYAGQLRARGALFMSGLEGR